MPHTFNEQDLENFLTISASAAGWTYIPAENLPREQSDVLVEPYVKDALIRLNPCIANHPAFADDVIYKLRALINSVRAHDLIAQNEQFKKLVFEENSFPFDKNGRSISIKFFDYENVANNSLVITNQWVYPRAEGGKRLDLVLLINGFPVAIGEVKSPFRPAVSWVDAVNDIHAYEQSIPQMFVTNIFNFATEGKAFRYGSLNAPIEKWGPWFSGIPHEEGDMASVQEAFKSIIHPETVLDLFRYFTLFSTDKHNIKIKVVCRYQQYEGANLIVERCLAGAPKKGLIWHFQGSGKSLLMVFAAMKLRMCTKLHSPTVIIVNDRIDLSGQIFGTFAMADVPNLVQAATCEELTDLLRKDSRKVICTKIFEFQKVQETLNYRDNIIVMVDEAHRTQEGDLGVKMRLALPNAFFFGLTGTPINRLDKNTFLTFGADEDRSGYMSRYTFADSVKDGATLPLNFEPVPVGLHVDEATIDAAFDELTEEAELSSDQKNQLARRVKVAAIFKNPDRVHAVCEHIAKHFMDNVYASGYKAQVVCYDRETCLLYKKELDKLLPTGVNTTIVMDTNNDKADLYKEWRRSSDEEQKLLDDFRTKDSPLKIVIVTSKLLTGFDAPILQTMYLDKPMKDHTLLQAICRTNRVYGQEKAYGLIVDYVGIFDDVAKALNFSGAEVERVVTNIEKVKAKVPELVRNCIAFFPGVDRTSDEFENLLAAQQCLPDDKTKDDFGAHFRSLHRVWNALSPDPCLMPFKADYKWLAKVYESVRPVDSTGSLIWAALGPKTLELVYENTVVESVDTTIETIEMDAKMIEKFIGDDKPDDPDDSKKKKLLIDLARLIHMYPLDDRYVQLGKRIEELRAKQEQGLINSIEFLKALLEIAKDAVELQKETKPFSKEDEGQSKLTQLFSDVRTGSTPVIVERIVKDIDEIVKLVRFPGWQNTPTGRNEVSRNLRDVVLLKYRITDRDVFDRAYSYVATYY